MNKSEAAQQLGKLGGLKTKLRNPDHLKRISALGLAKRWSKKAEQSTTNTNSKSRS